MLFICPNKPVTKDANTPRDAISRLEQMLGMTGMPFDDDMVGAKGVNFTIGPHHLEFVMPTDASSPLVNWMREYGPSPYSATLLGPGANPPMFDLELSHGANLSFGQ